MVLGNLSFQEFLIYLHEIFSIFSERVPTGYKVVFRTVSNVFFEPWWVF